MSLIPQPEQPTPTIRSVKIPRHRLRSYGSCLKSVHRPGAHLTLPADPITVVCISDTHGTKPPLPPGDILLNAGDLSVWGTCAEIQEQLTWLATQPHRYKVVIAGNHDLLLDDRFQDKHPKKWRQIMKVARVDAEEEKARSAEELEWGDIIYLRNTSVTLDLPNARSITIYGSPDTPEYGYSAFQYPRDEDVWKKRVPKDTDIVLTHGPPWGHLDGMKKSGCRFLARETARVRPRLVVFGHIHVGYGTEEIVLDGAGETHEAIHEWYGSVWNPSQLHARST